MHTIQNKNQYCPRTDLANECVEMHFGNSAPDNDGIKVYSETRGGIAFDILEILNREGSEKLGKPTGKYVTANIGKITLYTRERFVSVVSVCADVLSELIPQNGSCLFACLGNRQIASDAQGPLCADHLIVSKHILSNAPELFSNLSLAETMCIVPDVLGNTGIEAADIVRGVADKVKPSFVIAVDSLASRKTSRIGSTLQFSNAGIAPGSGVGNHRTALSFETLGIPVISLGVPTVVDAVTVGADILKETFGRTDTKIITEKTKENILESVLKNGSYGYFVAPKDADKISSCAARLIGTVINKALNPGLEISEMEDITG